MINPKDIFEHLIKVGVEFFTGVPDSLLKDICAYISDNVRKEKNIIAANEGGAVALAAGYHLATRKFPMVYFQNSGIGNAMNPLLSLMDIDVYSIPALLMVGWRGEPGIKDEPQHLKQGKITLDLFKAMQIPYSILSDEVEKAKSEIDTAISHLNQYSSPYALIIRKNVFASYTLKGIEKISYSLTREDALKIIVNNLNNKDIVIATTGKTSRELFEYRRELGQLHENDFLTVGSMGHANQIALGTALNKPDFNIFCFDGDGAIIMHTGSLGIIGDLSPTNFKHIVFNNGAHDSVGGQPTIGYKMNFSVLAKSFNYKYVHQVTTFKDLNEIINDFKQCDGPALLEICLQKGARSNLGRPDLSPLDNKISFMKYLSNETT